MGLGADKERDIFISTREAGLVVLTQVREQLRRAGLKCWDWDNTAEVGAKHKEATNGMIAGSRATLVLVTNDYFEKASHERVCYQEEELKRALQTHERNPSHTIAFLILQTEIPGEGSWPTIGQCKDAFETRYPTLCLTGFEFRELPNGRADYCDPGWTPVLQSLAAHLAKAIGAVRAKERAEEAEEVAAKAKSQPHAAVSDEQASPEGEVSIGGDLTDVELDYVGNALLAWIEGRAGDMEATGKTARGDLRERGFNPFDFDPQRFIVLPATEVGAGTAGCEDEATQALPITNWLFDAERPIVMRGAAGAGGTCTLAMTAVAFASRLNEGFKLHCEGLRGPREFFGTESNAGAVCFVPVLLKARRIAACIDEGTGQQTDALFSAVASAMHVRGAGKPLSARAMRARMYERPYAILVDELDRLSSDVEKRILSLLSSIDSQFKARNAPIKIIATGKPPPRAGSFVEVMLKSPSDAQRTAFFGAFAAGRPATAAADRGRIELAARRLHDLVASATGAAEPEPFDTPLLLNAFCWCAVREDFEVESVESRIALCEKIMEFLLSQLDERAGNADAQISSEQARTILRALAIEGLSRSDGEVDSKSAQAIVKAIVVSSENIEYDTLLGLLAQQTGLLERIVQGRRSAYRVKGLFADYLAAEHIETRGIDSVLQRIDDAQEAALVWRQALAFACSLSFARNRADAALHMCKVLLQRASAAETQIEQADWFVSAIIALAALPPTGAADGFEARRQSTLEEAADCWAAWSERWTPQQRVEALSYMSAAARSDSAAHTRQSVEALWRRMLEVPDEWIEAAVTRPDGEREVIHVAAMPVLVAEYDEFLASLRRTRTGERVSTATRTPDDQVVIRHHAPLSHRGEAGADVYVELHATPAVPIVFVSYFEAVAYAEWLTRRMRGRLADGEVIRIPTVSEWRLITTALAGNARYVWGREDPGRDENARVNWRGAKIGHATPPGAFPSYGAPGLFDFGTNVSVWTTPERATGEMLWPPSYQDEVRAVGGNFASPLNEILGGGRETCHAPSERSRDRGIRLIRTRRVTGWGNSD